eukprot:scaffold3798_cov152-Cylindrotheca_fusiformis.AAC.1
MRKRKHDDGVDFRQGQVRRKVSPVDPSLALVTIFEDLVLEEATSAKTSEVPGSGNTEKIAANSNVKATKGDDASVQVELWDQRLCE